MRRLLDIVLPIIGKKGIFKYFILGIFSGLSGFFFINAVTKMVEVIMEGRNTRISIEYILVFLAIVLMFIWARRSLGIFSISLSQRISWTLRLQILRYTLGSNYEQLSARKAKIHSTILNDVGALTNASMAVIDFFTSLVIAISCLIYLASISFILFVVTLCTSIIGIAVYVVTSKSNIQKMDGARKLEK